MRQSDSENTNRNSFLQLLNSPLLLLSSWSYFQTSPPNQQLKRHSATVELARCVCVCIPPRARCACHSSMCVHRPLTQCMPTTCCVCVCVCVCSQTLTVRVCVLWSLPTTSHHSTPEVHTVFHIRNLVIHYTSECVHISRLV